MLACLKAMLPAMPSVVSIERTIAMPASVIATSTISAMNSTTPRCLRITVRPGENLRQVFMIFISGQGCVQIRFLSGTRVSNTR